MRKMEFDLKPGEEIEMLETVKEKITLKTIIEKCTIAPPFTRLELYHEKYGKIKFNIPHLDGNNVVNNLKVGQNIQFKNYGLKSENYYSDINKIYSINHEDYDQAVVYRRNIFQKASAYNGNIFQKIFGKLGRFIGPGRKLSELDANELLNKRNSLNVGPTNDSYLIERR